jgi:lipoprotein NlpI
MKMETKSWPYPVILYLRREATAEQLLTQATDGDKKTEAQAYIGTDLLLSGRSEEAKPYLQWVKDNGNKNFVEYALAVAQLKSLEKETVRP